MSRVGLQRADPPEKQPQALQPTRAPPKDGPLLQGTRPETQTDPAASWEGTDPVGRVIRISRFDELHFRQARELSLSVIRVERTSARDIKRDPRVSWFLTLDDVVPLEQVPERYGLRFSQEHLFRFCKQDLLWTQPRVRTAAQFLLWSWIVALAFTQLYLARPLGLAELLHWEAKGRPVTPRQVRRVMPTILAQIGTPARACQPRGKAPGRAKGFHPKPALRHWVIGKTSHKKKKRQQAAPT